jgi:hypothetical protein
MLESSAALFGAAVESERGYEMKLGAAVLFLALAPSGAAIAQVADEGKAIELPKVEHRIAVSQAIKTAVMTAVKKELRDPASAQFGPMSAFLMADKSVDVCGEVNAKNGFGGYTGRRLFWAPLVSFTGRRGNQVWFGPGAVIHDDDDPTRFYELYPFCDPLNSPR